ncbi:hypothetical protein GNI_127740 [Gregarina niphandrodes]|uniref:Integrase zinc-binding domain-containing protein n=1 Tax=Gregarina niphandrodes TaxID=110365 RepID=A0A023B2B5_GRENI|nr:hypothetical protein GNI_127740 [Gregarina niphandrodes]EZG49015.1 hypothetical protein GNI_127740 [Gregarina niphandrodes]|eukprot:XP_011132059.1 hypothetical protein GNI_127740 [Gregarina niphandrodes]
MQGERIDAVKNAEVPSDKRGLQSFLGLVGHLRPFIPRFADYTAPLFDLLKKGTVFAWGPGQADAFKAPKEAGVEAARMRRSQGGREVPLEFVSKKFTAAEYRWTDYVTLAHFTVKTDHANLRYLTGVDKGKVFQWTSALSRFDFTLEFVSGERNCMADCLSRYAAGARTMTRLWNRWPLGARCAYGGTSSREPADGGMRTRVISLFHSGSSGHMGGFNTSKRVMSLYYWPGLAADVAQTVKDCLVSARERRRAPITHPVPGGNLDAAVALDLVSLDHVGPLNLGRQNWWILVAVDHATRYLGAWITSLVAARQMVKIFYRGWVVPFGIPRIVLRQRDEFQRSISRCSDQMVRVAAPDNSYIQTAGERHKRSFSPGAPIRALRAMAGEAKESITHGSCGCQGS